MRKAYQIGATDDVQTQLPEEIEAWGEIKESKDPTLHWKRELYTPTYSCLL